MDDLHLVGFIRFYHGCRGRVIMEERYRRGGGGSTVGGWSGGVIDGRKEVGGGDGMGGGTARKCHGESAKREKKMSIWLWFKVKWCCYGYGLK